MVQAFSFATLPVRCVDVFSKENGNAECAVVTLTDPPEMDTWHPNANVPPTSSLGLSRHQSAGKFARLRSHGVLQSNDTKI